MCLTQARCLLYGWEDNKTITFLLIYKTSALSSESTGYVLRTKEAALIWSNPPVYGHLWTVMCLHRLFGFNRCVKTFRTNMDIIAWLDRRIYAVI